MSKIKEYLLPGRSIEMESDDLKKPLRTLIESEVEDGVFRALAPMSEGRTYIFAGTEMVNVIFSYQEGGVLKVAQIRCRIVKKGMLDGLPVLTLQILGDPVPTQRRRAFRVNVLSRMVGQLEQGQIVDLTSKDISVHGMLLYSNIRIERGKVLRILWNHEGSESRLDDPEFLERAFSGEEEYDDSETVESKLNQLLDKDSTEFKKQQLLKEERKTYFVIDAHIISCDYDKEIGKYALRVNYDHIIENHTKRILRFLYKKQAEIMGNDPDVADRIDKFFASEEAERPLPSYVSLFSMGAFFIGVLAVVFFMLAKPAGSSFMDSFFNISRSKYLKTTELQLSLISASIAALFEFVSFGLRVRLAVLKTNRLHVIDALRPLLFALVAFYIISFYINSAG